MKFFDLQVNGYAGVDFNQDDLSPDDLHRACAALERDATPILATFITDHVPRMAARIGRVVALRQTDPLIERMIPGIHIEGPFISGVNGWRGAHPQDAVRPADPDAMKTLLEAAGGLTRIVTLAPECDAKLRVTRMLADLNITVSAGHCDPTLAELDAAIDAGLSMFTHVGNGCPPVLPRHDNIVQRAISRAQKLWLCFIADGAHVPLFALQNYFRAATLDRCVVVSDAIAPAGLGPGRFTVARWVLDVGEDLVARSPDGSHLVGSAMSLHLAQKKLESIGLTPAQIRMLTLDNPQRAVGLTRR